MVKRYTEVFDPNHSQECICHRGPMDRGLEESTEGDFVDIEDYKELKNQLAKANERVKELEQANLELAANVEACCELTDMDMGAAIERLFEIDNTESKALLNKFAIEQKVEAVTVFASSANEMGQFGWSDCQWLTDYAEEWVEQLSKEQTSE